MWYVRLHVFPCWWKLFIKSNTTNFDKHVRVDVLQCVISI